MKDKGYGIGLTHAWNGILYAFIKERNFRIHLILACVVLIFSVVLRISYLQWLVVLIMIGSVMVAELFNTAIEKLLDYVKPDIDPRAKVIKDIAAGAVLIMAMTAAIVGSLIFIPKILALF